MNSANSENCKTYAGSIAAFTSVMVRYIETHGESIGNNITYADLERLQKIAVEQSETKDPSQLSRFLNEDLLLALDKIDNEKDANALHQLVFETSHCIQGFASAVKDASVFNMLSTFVHSAEDVAQWKGAIMANLEVAKRRYITK